MNSSYDVIVVGAGHAGCEAAAAAANLGSKVLLITMNMGVIAQMELFLFQIMTILWTLFSLHREHLSYAIFSHEFQSLCGYFKINYPTT